MMRTAARRRQGPLLRRSTVAERLPAFIQSRKDLNLRSDTLRCYYYWSRWMQNHWGRKQIHGITSRQILAQIDLKGRRFCQNTLCFFRWLIAQKILPRTFDSGRLPRRSRTDERDICILSPKDAKRFLEVVRPKYRAYFILGMYAGIRPFELMRLDWKDVHFRERRIRISGSVSKIRRARLIEGVPPILWRLLKPYRKVSGPIVAARLGGIRAERNRAEEASGVTLGYDIMRHTFATYFVAFTGNTGMAAKVLGHFHLGTLSAHYDGVATKAAAKEYFTFKEDAL